MTPIMTAPSITKPAMVMTPCLTKSKVRKIPGHIPWMIEKKMRRLMPFPIPRSVICSPNHITKMAPVVSVSIVMNRNPQPGLTTAPASDSVKIAKPYACPAASTTVV